MHKRTSHQATGMQKKHAQKAESRPPFTHFPIGTLGSAWICGRTGPQSQHETRAQQDREQQREDRMC